MIESLKLTNLQTHRSLEIEFSPAVTTIIGPSDAGKSAILRGMRWLCLNDIATKDLLKWNTKKTVVRLVVDGHTVSRKRTGSTNLYTLDGKKFHAFKSDIPSAIQSLLNVSHINFQDQHDSPFWFKESAGNISRELNSIVNLGAIDQTLGNVASQLRRARAEHDVTEQRFREAKKDKESLDWVDECNAEFEQVEQLEKAFKTTQLKTAALRAHLKLAAKLQTKQRNARRRLLGALATLKLGKQASSIHKQANELRSLLRRIKKLQHRASLGDLDMPDINELGSLLKNRESLESHLLSMKDQEETLCVLRKQLQHVQEKAKASSFKVCPVCERKMP